MKSEVRRKLEMVARVREFIQAHAAAEPGYAPVLERLQGRLTRAGTIATREQEGRAAARSARDHREELRRVLHFQLLRYLTAVGSVAAKDRAELAAKFKLPSANAPNPTFLTSVNTLIRAAAEQKDALVAVGMKPELLDDLNRMVVEFGTVLEAVRTARRDHIGANVDLDTITTELLDEVKVLDGITRYRFGMDPEVMGEWNAVKRVPGQPGRGKNGNGASPAGNGGQAPTA